MTNTKITYIAKENCWFDDKTEAFLVEDYSHLPAEDENGNRLGWGLFTGLKNNNYETVHCQFDEFEIY